MVRGGDVYKPSYFSNVPTSATSRLQEILAAKAGTTWARNGRWILPENVRLPRNIQGSFTCRKSTTWGIRLYFPSEGRRAEDFFSLKNLTASVGFEPANLGTKGQHVTFRPPKTLCVKLRVRCNVKSVANVTVDHFNNMHVRLRLYNFVYTIINGTPCHQEASAV